MRRPSSRRIVFTAATCLLVSCLEGPTSPLAESPAARRSADAGNPGATGITFEALAIGDSVKLHFQSDGCFHHFGEDAVLTRTASGLAIRVAGMTANLAPGWHLEAETALSLEQVRALDRTLDYFRSGPDGGCTTVEHLTIVGFNGARAESYVDASCGTYEEPTMFAIGRLFHMVRDSARMDNPR